MTIITSAKKDADLPTAVDLQAHDECYTKKKPHFYSVNETTHASPELVYVT